MYMFSLKLRRLNQSHNSSQASQLVSCRPLVVLCSRKAVIESLEGLEGTQEVAGALVAGRVVVEVELVVLLGGPPLAGGRNLGDDLAVPPLLVGLGGDLARDLFLLGVVVVDGGAVLRAGVGALGVEGRGVVELVEELEELAVGDLLGVKDDLGGFGVCV